jgi:hypothetical protein
MRTLFLMSALAFGLAPADLATEYKTGPGRKVTIESSVRMETTASEFERDGETRSMGVGATSNTERTEVHVDHVVEAEGGKPTKVRRHFLDLGGKSSFEAGEMSRESELESPWRGVTLELSADSDKVDAKVVAGTEPDGEGVLEGHTLTLFLDGLLPKGAVEEGKDWEIPSEAIVRALRLDLQRKLYPPPARPEGEGAGGGGRGRRGRGGMGGSGDVLGQSDWKGTGKFAGTEEKDGTTCAVIELELETSGEREIEARGPGGGRGGALALPFENKRTWSAKLEGKLYYDVKAKRPMLLELEGDLKIESRTEREREGSVSRSYTAQSGKIDYTVEIEDAPAEDAKPAK